MNSGSRNMVLILAAMTASCGASPRASESGTVDTGRAGSAETPTAAPKENGPNAVASIPVPAGTFSIELDFTGRGLQPWIVFQARPGALTPPIDQVLREEGMEPTAVKGTRRLSPLSLGALPGQLVTASLIDRFCRPHVAWAEDTARKTWISFFACSENPAGDAAVLAGFAAFSAEPGAVPAAPPGTRSIAMGPYTMAVPEGLRLSYASAQSEAGESIDAKLVQSPCLSPGSDTWADEMQPYSQSQWTVTTKESEREGRRVLWAVLDESSAADASIRIIHKACVEDGEGGSLQIELSSSQSGALTVTFEDLVSALLPLGLPKKSALLRP